MSLSSPPALGVWRLELDGRTYSIELAEWSESTGLPGAVTSDGASCSLGHWLGGLPQVVSFEVGGHPAALQWAYRARLGWGALLWVPLVGSDTVRETTEDWWTYELAVDGTREGMWVLHGNEWSFVPPGGDLTTPDPSRRTYVLPVRELSTSRRSIWFHPLVTFVVLVVVVVILVLGFYAWLLHALSE